MSNNFSATRSKETRGPFASVLAKAFERHAEALTRAFEGLSECLHFLEFAREQFCGLDVPSVSPDPKFLQGWAGVTDRLVALLKDSSVASDQQSPDQRHALIVESFVNSLLARLTVEDDPQICWGAAVAYAREQGRPMLAGSLQFMLTLTGVYLSERSESAGDAMRLHGAGTPVLPEKPFHWANPIRCTPLGFYSLTTGTGFLQLLSPGFLECSRLIDLESAGGLIAELEILRLLQREVCMLTEDWEFRNAVLAVGFTEARDLLISTAARHRHAEANVTLGKINQNRDELAVWFCWALIEMERLISDIRAQADQVPRRNGETPKSPSLDKGLRSVTLADVVSECAAVESAILAAMQKLFLPASVSRHDYHPEVLWACFLWAQARMARVHDDFAARITGLALSWHQGRDSFEREALDLLNSIESLPTLNWFLSFDASAALKSFCWSLPRNAHAVICCLYGEMLVRKAALRLGRLDNYWASVLVSIAQMPETFSGLRVRRCDHRAEMAVFSDSFQSRFGSICRRLSQFIPERAAEGDELLGIWNLSCRPLCDVAPHI